MSGSRGLPAERASDSSPPTSNDGAIEGWANTHGHQVVRIHKDLDQSGAAKDRPGLAAAMDRVEAGTVKGIVRCQARPVWALGCSAGRSPEPAARFRWIAVRSRGRDRYKRSNREHGRHHPRRDRGMRKMDRIRGNWRGARSSAVERGVFVGGTVPLGYHKDVDGNGRGQWPASP